MRLLAVLPLFALSVPALAGCGADAEPQIPPLIWESGLPAQDAGRPATAPAEESLPARMILYRFLRGVAYGSARVCAYLTPEYAHDAFPEPDGCRSGFAEARALLGTRTLIALRGVTVPVARPGPGPDDLTVRFGDLRWRTTAPRPGGLLAERFVLRRAGDQWRIAA